MNMHNHASPDILLRRLQAMLAGSIFRISGRGVPIVHHRDHRISWFGRNRVFRVFHGHRGDAGGESTRDFQNVDEVVQFFVDLPETSEAVLVCCPYCKAQAILRPASYVYGQGRDYGKLYVCANYPICDAYVGVHEGTINPKGSLAKAGLRQLRKEAHAVFDPLWTGKGKYSRLVAYRAAAKVLNFEEFHLGFADEDTCARLIANITTIKELVDNDTSHPLHQCSPAPASQQTAR